MHPRIEELLGFIEVERSKLREAVDSVPPALRGGSPGDGRWSVAQVLEHLGTVEGRITAMFSKRVAEGRAAGIGAEAAWTTLQATRVAFREAILAADGMALGEITQPHLVFGPLTLYNWIAFAGGHEARHAAQIRETGASFSRA